jgi:TolB-like protein
MSSIIEGYNYDIFISYRQKDNKHDGWVTKFVENLKGELEATFKEDVSVYFDENPHDRLQETHNVNKSLEGKLKCLIFIPILSQTYCDPNSYAWQNEFLPFLKMAAQDRFGKDIKLRNGNVASRILPIRIHDLEPEDVKLFEKETGSVLRTLDFVFRTSTGVCRPLKANEDHPQDNLNKTFYSDQINKVGHAIKEIILGMKTEPAIKTEEKSQEIKSTEDEKKSIQVPKKRLIGLISSMILLIAIVVTVLYFSNIIGDRKPAKELEKSIAVLPFRNDSPDSTNKYFIEGTMEAILDNLCKIADLTVISRTSVEQFRSTTKPIREIAKLLNVNYILEGSGQKYGNDIRLTVQLIDAVNDKHIWSSPYEGVADNIFKLQNQISQAIATELKAIIVPEEKQLIEKIPTKNMVAFNLFSQARSEHMKYWMENTNIAGLNRAMILYHRTLLKDSTYAQAYSGLAMAYIDKYYAQSGLKTNFLDSTIIYANKALRYNDRLDEAFYVKGNYYSITGDYDRALQEFNEAIKINPNYSWAYTDRSGLYYVKIWDTYNAFNDRFKSIQLEHGPFRPAMLRSLGQMFSEFEFPETARYYNEEALKLDNDSITYLNNLMYFELYQNTSVALELSDKVLKRDPSNLDALWHELDCYELMSRYKDAYSTALNILQIYNKMDYSPQDGWQDIGYVFWKTGHIKEAKFYFDKQIDLCEKRLKIDPKDDFPKLTLIQVYAALGEKGKALQLLNVINDQLDERLKKGTHVVSVPYIYYLKYDPLLDNLRSDPLFQKLEDHVEKVYYVTHEKLKVWLEEKGMLN